MEHSERPQLPVAVMAGAAQGVGYLSAIQLSATHRIVVVDLPGNQVAEAAAACGADAIGVECDLIDQAQVEAAVARIVSQVGGIDTVVVSAGIGIGGALRLTHPDVVAAQLNINVAGNWRFIHACLPHVIARRGT